ncbi:MAG: MbnP family protein [Marinirhabdus sp.]|nr:MbnP family protein [Marinirhabdus sp.]
MNKFALIFLFIAVFISCNSDDDTVVEDPVNTFASFTFSHNWDGDAIVNSDYETTTYTNAFGTEMELSKLVYLISDITFTASDGTVYNAEDYNLVTARSGSGTSFVPDIQIPEGNYTVSFTFGFDDEDNDKAGGYPDLNSADGSWNVPEPLGGGYHYMRLEGSFVDDEMNTDTFQYHTIRANRHSTLPPGQGTLVELKDTSFEVDLGAIEIVTGTNIEVQMNVAEWFKNPNTWNLNENSQVLMPKFDVQIQMHENGKNGVFSRGTVEVIEL